VASDFCVRVRALKEKQLELSTLNLVDIWCMAVARHLLTLRSKGQISRSRVMKCTGLDVPVNRTAILNIILIGPILCVVVVVGVVDVFVVDIDFTLPFTAIARCRYCRTPPAHLGSGVDSSDTW